MVFKGSKLTRINDIFEKAVEVALNNPTDIDSFLDSYVNSIIDSFSNSISRKEATLMAKKNLSTCSSYYKPSTIKLVVESYSLQHPIEDLV